MNKMKKLASLVLALVMAFALAAPAFASENEGENPPETRTTGSITITPQNDDDGGKITAEYEYYQLLRATLSGEAEEESGKPTGSASYYLLVDGDKDKTLKPLLEDLFKFTMSSDGSKWIAELKDEDMSGDDLASALNTDKIKDAALSHEKFSMNQEGTKAESGAVDVGYYLITSTLGTNLVLQTLGDVTIETKNEEITTAKTASKTNMSVGDMVTYTITVHIPNTANENDPVSVYDTLDEHLKYNDDIQATCNNAAVSLTDGTNDNNYTFVKTFAIGKEMIGKDVILTYTAELQSTAANDEGYVNNAFSRIPGYETKPGTAKVYTFDFDLEKTFTNVDATTAAGYTAKFELYDKDNKKIEFIKDTTGDTVKYVKADSDDADKVPVLEINGGQVINILGLAEGSYTLKETETAPGYNLLTDDVTVTIRDTTEKDAAGNPIGEISHTVSYTIGEKEYTNVDKVSVENNQGSLLPSTGGIGTTIFYIVGGVLVAGAVILLITKRRMNIDKD